MTFHFDRPHFYLLNPDHTTRPSRDLIEWSTEFEWGDRHVGYEMVGDVRLSTVFLGIDHNFSDSGPPLLFETMVFGGPLNHDGERYATWSEAEAGHARWREAIVLMQEDVPRET